MQANDIIELKTGTKIFRTMAMMRSTDPVHSLTLNTNKLAKVISVNPDKTIISIDMANNNEFNFLCYIKNEN